MSSEKIVNPVWNLSLVTILSTLIICFFSLYRRELKLNQESINPVRHTPIRQVREDKERQRLKQILEEIEKYEIYAKQRLRKLEEEEKQ